MILAAMILSVATTIVGATTAADDAAVPSIDARSSAAKVVLAAEAKEEAKPRRRRTDPEEQGEIGFFDRHFPFSLNENLDTAVDEDFWLIYVVGLVAGTYGGPLWIPKVVTGLDPGTEYNDEALWKWLTDLAILVGGIVMIYPCMLTIVGWVVPLAFVVVYAYWFGPIGTVNMFDRHVKRARREGTLKGKSAMPKDLRDAMLMNDDTLAMQY